MLQDIQLRIKEGLSKLNDYIYQSLQGEDPQLQQFIKYLLQQQGKQLRPQLVLSVALVLGADIKEKTLRGAGLVSLLHNASLIHDDVVDEATYRRHTKTFNAVWDNKLAVLFGDYLLATILRVAVKNQDYDYLSVLATTAQAMSEGEIMQLVSPEDSIISESDYLRVIQKKTASLFGASCAIGAFSVAVSLEKVKVMYSIGEQFGMAFQLRDDLLDYKGSMEDMGKAAFMDLKTHKLTLPLIYALQQVSFSEAQSILDIIYHHSDDGQTFQKVVSFVNEQGGMNYTLKKVLYYQEKALEILKNSVPLSVYRDALTILIQEALQL